MGSFSESISRTAFIYEMGHSVRILYLDPCLTVFGISGGEKGTAKKELEQLKMRPEPLMTGDGAHLSCYWSMLYVIQDNFLV